MLGGAGTPLRHRVPKSSRDMMLSRLKDYVVASFELPVDEPAFRKTVELCRVMIGAGMLHRYVDIAGFLVAASNPEQGERDVFVAILACLGVMFGALTPLALATLFYFTLYTPFGFTLGHQIVGIVAWVLLFSGAGRRWSVDAHLVRLPVVSKLLGALYVLEQPFTPRGVAWIRLFALLLFWSISFGAMAFHVKDSLWLKGNVLQLLMVTPYMTDFAELMRAFRDATPQLYDTFWSSAIMIQSVFELFLWPLCLFRWGRIFVAAQWLGFIAIRAPLMNLGYLCWDELILWLLVFSLTPWAVWHHRVPSPASGAAASTVGFRGAILRAFVGAAVVVCVYFNIVNFAQINAPQSSLARLPYLPTVFRVFGQWPVNVFNKEDMSMGEAQLVIVETDEDSNVLRVVPYVDYQGGRLGYLRNDFLYFGIGLPWQRLPPAQQAKTAPETARRVALVDAALQGEASARYYVALLFTQQVEPYQGYERWTPTKFKAGFGFKLGSEEVKAQLPPRIPAFDLPPGHFGEAARQAETLSQVHALAEKGVLRALPRFRFVDDANPR